MLSLIIFTGHLSSVFCLLFDKTGNYVFTGADDLLVKVSRTKNNYVCKFMDLSNTTAFTFSFFSRYNKQRDLCHKI